MKLHIRVSPNAKQSSVLGWEPHPLYGKVLRLRIAAPPTDGKANEAIIAFMAKTLGLSKSSITLDKGSSSRDKTLLTPDDCPLPEEW